MNELLSQAVVGGLRRSWTLSAEPRACTHQALGNAC